MQQILKINWPEGLSAEKFLQDYWQKQPLLIRNALPTFENPLTPDELGGLALEDEINSRLILREARQLSNGKVDSKADTQWHMRSGPFTEDELTDLPAENWSLLVSDIEKHLDGFHQYLQPFRFVPDWQIDDLMISYAPTGASVGAHVDEYDVFLLQAWGKREWFIDSRSDVDTSFIPDLDIKVLQNFNANEQWVLEPGDMLYLPPGVPHHGISLDNDCMTWSIGFRAIAHSDLVTEIAQQIAQRSPDTARYRDTVAQLQAHPGEVSAENLSALHTLWKQMTEIEFEDFKCMAGNVLTQRNDAFIAEDLQQDDSFEDLLANSTIARDAASRLAFIKTDSVVTLHADGHSYPVTEALACMLCDGYTFAVNELQSLLIEGEQNKACVLNLWQRGVLLPGS